MGFVNKLFGGNTDYQAKSAPYAEGSNPNLVTNDYSQYLKDALAANATTPKNTVDFGLSNQTRGRNDALLDALNASAEGRGPSLAQQQLQQSTQQNIANSQSQLGSARGMNPALAARLILQNSATQNQNMAQQGATLRLQEQMAARQQLSEALRAQRQQDLSQALGGSQADLAASDLNLKKLGTLGDLQGKQNALIMENYLKPQDIQAKIAAANAAGNASVAGAGIGALGSIIGSGVLGGGDKKNGSTSMLGKGVSGVGDAASWVGNGVWSGVKGAGEGIGDAASWGYDQVFPSYQSTNGGSGGGSSSSSGGGGAGGNPGPGQDSGAPNQTTGTTGGSSGGSGGGISFSKGGRIDGKAEVPGDSYKNDKVEVKASPEEIIIPRSKAKDPQKAHEFIDALFEKEKGKHAEGYGKVLKAYHDMHGRLSEIEKLAYGGRVC